MFENERIKSVSFFVICCLLFVCCRQGTSFLAVISASLLPIHLFEDFIYLFSDCVMPFSGFIILGHLARQEAWALMMSGHLAPITLTISTINFDTTLNSFMIFVSALVYLFVTNVLVSP